MKAFGELLRKQLNRADITIYRMAKIANIDRTLLNRVLSGERTLTRDHFDALLHYLPLTPEETEELNEAYVIAQVGETRYRRRQKVLQLLGELAQIDEQWDSGSARFATDAAAPDAAIYEGAYAVETMLEALVSRELCRAAPRLWLTLPPERVCLCRMLQHALRSCGQLRVEHIIQLRKNGVGISDNIDTLGVMLPLSFAGGGRYQPYYYYGESQVASLNTAMPYYLLADGCAVLLSADLKLALLTREKTTVQVLEKSFESARRRCRPLNQRTGDIHEMMAQNEMEALMLQCNDVFFAATPCFGRVFTSEIIRKYLCTTSGVLRHEDVERIYSRICFTDVKERNIFPRAGLMEFASTGRIPYLPQGIAYPIQPEDRAAFLRGIREAYDNGEIELNMIDESHGRICRRVALTMRLDQALCISLACASSAEYSSVTVQEPTLISAFSDFFASLPDSSLLMSQEDTLAALDNALALCAAAASEQAASGAVG